MVILLVFGWDWNKIAIAIEFYQKTVPEMAPGFEIMADTQPVIAFVGEL